MPKPTRLEIESERPWAQQAEVEMLPQPDGYHGDGFWVKRARSGHEKPEIRLEQPGQQAAGTPRR